MECKESKFDEAIRNYEKEDVLFTLKRDEDDYSVIEGKMPLGKNKDGVVEDFNRCSQLTMDNTCEEDKEIFQKMFREKEQISEKEPPTYSCYNHEGELILDLYLNLGQETGTGIYYGETQVSRYITQFDVESWKPGVWEDNKYSLIRAGEKAATELDGYQEYREYNNRGQIISFYSEGIVTGWGEPHKETLVQIKFSYRDDGTLEKKSCNYNQHIYGTTRQSETFYFDREERLTYATAYVTYGMLSDYYFYEEGEHVPSYHLTLDHRGLGCYGDLEEYGKTEESGEES